MISYDCEITQNEKTYVGSAYVGEVYWQPLKDCMVCTHSGNSQLNYTTLWYFLKQIGAETSHDYSIEIVHMMKGWLS